MLVVTDINEINDIFFSKAPRPWRDIVLEVYPDATEDRNGRFHAPYDGYECTLTGRTFRAGEYLPMTEPDDEARPMYGVARRFPTAVDLEGNPHSWDGTRGQNLAVWSKLFEQTRAHEATISKHVGEIGGKIQLNVTLNFVKAFNGFYGDVWIHVMKDELGNVIVYKGSKCLGKKGDSFVLQAKVKEHGEREGVKQTIVERPKLVV
jgi:hypothetical protein